MTYILLPVGRCFTTSNETTSPQRRELFSEEEILFARSSEHHRSENFLLGRLTRWIIEASHELAARNRFASYENHTVCCCPLPAKAILPQNAEIAAKTCPVRRGAIATYSV